MVVATGASGGVGDDDEAIVFTDTGWFQLEHTSVPSADDLALLQKNVGNVGALDPPAHWDEIKDPTIVQQHMIMEGDPERDAVVRAFTSTLAGPKTVKVVKVERIQNLSMWQSYVVKRQVSG